MPDYIVTWLHLLAMSIFLGGLVFVQLILNPGLKEGFSENQKTEILRRLGRRFQTIAWVCIITLIVTGAYQMLNESGSARIETNWGAMLLVKLFFFAIVFALVLIHDFIIDPYAAYSKKLPSSIPSSAFTRADNLQKAVLVMTLTILLVASYLKMI